MRRYIRFLAIILSVTLVIPAIELSTFNAAAETDGVLEYEIWDDVSQACVIGLTDSSYSGEIIIPRFYKGNKVVIINKHAFKNCTGITSVTIPDTIEYIAAQAFLGCSNLNNIVLPDTVFETAQESFYNTGYYNNSDNWKDGLLYIGKHLIASNGVSGERTVEPGTLTIGFGVFWNNKNINKVNLPNSLTYIGTYAFYGCTGLEKIIIPSSLRTIGSAAFCDCNTIKSLTIPKGVENIDDWAFAGCNALETVSISKSVSYISGTAFNGSGIKSITIDGQNQTYKIIGNCIVETKTKTLVEGFDFSEIPTDGSVTKIGSLAFSSTIKDFGYIIPEGIKEIGWGAFTACHFNNLLLPSSLSYIENGAFEDAYIENVYYSGTEAQREQINYETDGSNGNEPLITANWQFSMTPAFNYTVNGDTVTIDGISNSDFCGVLEIPAYIENKPVTAIKANAFQGNNRILGVVFPNTLTSIGDFSFMTCGNLRIVCFSESIKSIGRYAFSNCSSIRAIRIPDSVNSVGDGVFTSCSRLTDVTVGNGIAELSRVMFTSCSRLYHIELTSGLISIGDTAFSDCSSLRSIVIPENVKTVSASAFSNCSRLETVYLPKEILSIGASAFGTALKTVYYGGSITDRGSITVGNNNKPLNDAEWIYNYIEHIKGDINNDGSVNNKDLTRLFQYLSDWDVEVNVAALDVNGDSSINNKDLSRLFQYLSNWEVSVF